MILYEIEVNNKVMWRKLATEDLDAFKQKAIAQCQLLRMWHQGKEVKLIATILEIKNKGEVVCL